MKANAILPLILLQVIKTRWLQVSRGGQRASLRNAVPKVFSVTPTVINQTSRIYIQRIEFGEQNDFLTPIVNEAGLVAGSEIRVEGILLQLTAIGLYAALDLDPALGNKGAPARTSAIHGRPPPNFSLACGEWGRITYNNRYSGESNWWYESVVANIALTDNLDVRVFLRGEPKHQRSDLAELW